MSYLINLISDDFIIKKGFDSDILCTNIPNYSLILFYSPQCTHSKNTLPIIKQLPEKLNNCTFCIINVSSPQGRNVIQMSKNTKSVIDCVPMIILYEDGRPLFRYKGERNTEDIINFIVNCYKTRQKQSQLENRKNNNIKNFTDGILKKKIPDYSIGVPLCGEDDEDCYLTLSQLYK